MRRHLKRLLERDLYPEKMTLRFVRDAGLLSLHTNYGSIHFGVWPRHWIWGHEFEEYDCVLEYWGLGPLFLLAKLT